MADLPAEEKGASDGVFRCEGEYWLVVFAGVSARLRDRRGMRYLAVLLGQPHREVPAFTLCEPGADAAGGQPSPVARERARINVTRALHAALRRIEAYHPVLGAHLRTTVRTGSVCVYRPDPRLPILWETAATHLERATQTR